MCVSQSSRRLRRHLDDVPVLVVCLLFTANFMMAGMGVVIVALLLPAIGTLREMGEVSTHTHTWANLKAPLQGLRLSRHPLLELPRASELRSDSVCGIV